MRDGQRSFGPGTGTRACRTPGAPATRAGGFVNPAVHRGSTVLYPTMAERKAFMPAAAGAACCLYGVMGTPTHYPLEDVIAEIEGGTRCQIVSSGLAAVTTPLLAFLKAGDHMLMPDPSMARRATSPGACCGKWASRQRSTTR
jgi:cystathionine beta-lyase